jgi:hypothetical protein
MLENQEQKQSDLQEPASGQGRKKAILELNQLNQNINH